MSAPFPDDMVAAGTVATVLDEIGPQCCGSHGDHQHANRVRPISQCWLKVGGLSASCASMVSRF